MIKREGVSRLIITIIMFALMALILLPIFFLVATSFKAPSEILSSNAFFPKIATMVNYTHVLKTTPFLVYLKNSVVVAVTVTIGTTIMATMAAYAISRYRNKSLFLNGFSKILLMLQMFPLVLIMIPLYNIFMKLHLVGTLYSLMLANGTFAMPFAIWLLVGFFDVMPREIEESGTIDGCSRWQIFYHLIVPLATPCIASAGIFTFINSWNEYMMANILIKSDLMKTLPVGLATFIQQFGAEWGSLMSAATMTLLPVVFFLVFTQKYIVQGLTAGAVKG